MTRMPMRMQIYKSDIRILQMQLWIFQIIVSIFACTSLVLYVSRPLGYTIAINLGAVSKTNLARSSKVNLLGGSASPSSMN
jgi:hypothetical protein